MKKLLTTLFLLLLILVLLPISITNNEVKAEDPINEYTDDCITFSSEKSFTLKTANEEKYWDGTLWYSTDKKNWTEWNGPTITAAQTGGTGPYYLHVRGNSSNTRISDVYHIWKLTSSDNNTIACTGNIETLRGATGNNPSSTTMAGSCYACLFFNCTMLTSAPTLPATTLSDGCYNNMFRGCTSLEIAPELPATTLKNSCYFFMFDGCTRLKSTPALPATTLATSCYGNMFGSCISLQEASALPATSLHYCCYQHMFENCISLEVAPALPATELADSCYYNMFNSCTSLTTAPELPATTLKNSCYEGMFSYCTNLTTASDLPATTLAYSCYENMYAYSGVYAPADISKVTELAESCCSNMYEGCTNLKVYEGQRTGYILWKATSAETYVDYWNFYMLKGTGGDFTYDPGENETYSVSKASPIEYTCDDVLVIKDNSKHSISINVTEPVGATIQYSTDGGTNWNNYTSPIAFGPDYTPLTNIKFKVTKDGYKPEFLYKRYEIAYPIKPTETDPFFDGVIGEIYYEKGNASDCHISIDRSFSDFERIEIKKIDDNSATAISSSSYKVEGDSTNITILKSYLDTLDGGTHTFKVNVTYADGTYTYYLKVINTNHLTFTANTANSSVTPKFKSGSYDFSTDGGKTWVTGIGTKITLPNIGSKVMLKGSNCTTDAENHFSMTGSISASGDVTSLTNRIGGDTALTNNCYQYMFYGCTGLTQAPALPTTTLAEKCYALMFYGCINIKTTPTLPAKKLANYCYQQMFQGCTGLTQAPELPATTLPDYCYDKMFYDCSLIKLSLTKTGIYLIEYRIPTSETGTTGTNSLTDMFTNTGGTFTGTPDINKTYYAPKKSQTLTFAKNYITKTYGDSAFTNVLSGAKTTVTYSVGTEGVASINSSTGEVTILKAGTTTITATAAEDATYAKETANYTLTVKKAQVEVPTAITTLVYNKTEQTGVVLPSGAVYTLSNNTGTDANSYKATATLTNKDNYEWKITTPTSDDQEISWSIAKKEITVTPTSSQSKTYDGNDPSNIAYTHTGEAGSEEASFSGSLKLKDNAKDVGTHEIVNNDLVLVDNTSKGFKASNYELKLDTGITYEITKATITVTPTSSQTKVYDGSTATGITYTNSGAITGQTAKFSGALGLDNNAKDAGTHKIVQGTLVLEDNGDFKKNNYQISVADVNYSITQATLTVTPDSDQTDTYKGTSPTTTINYSSSGAIGSEEAKFSGSLKLNNDAIDAGKYEIVNKDLALVDDITSGFKANNYTLDIATGVTFEITKATLTVTPTSGQSNTYDGNDPSNIAYTHTGEAGSEEASFSGSLKLKNNAKDVGTHEIVNNDLVLVDNTSKGFKASNYELKLDTGITYEITKATITVTPDSDQTDTYKGTCPTTTIKYSSSGTIGSEEAKFSGSLKLKDNAKDVGTHEIINKDLTLVDDTTSGFKANNYTLDIATGITYEITKATLTVTPNNNQTKVYDGSTPNNITYKYNGNITGETPSFTGVLGITGNAVDVNTYKIVNNNLTLVDNGKFKANNYSLSVDDTIDYSITPATLTVTPDSNQRDFYKGVSPTTTIKYSSSGAIGSEEAKFSGSLKLNNDAIDAGKYEIVNKDLALVDDTTSGFKANNYTLDIATGVKYEITKRMITMTSGTSRKPYDGTPLTNGTIILTPHPGETEAFVSGEGFTPSVTGSQVEKGSSYNTFTYTLNDGTKESNYEITKEYGYLVVEYGSIDVTKSSNIKASADNITSTLTKGSISKIVIDIMDNYYSDITAKIIDKTTSVETDIIVQPGSIKLIVPTSFLDTLSVGTHNYTLKINRAGTDLYSYNLTITINKTPTPPYVPVPTCTK